MPTLPRVESTPTGQLGNVSELFPRSSASRFIGTAGQGAFESSQIRFDTAAQAANAGIVQSDAHLKVLEKLTASRESLEADNITQQATLSLRGQIQSLQSSGAHYSQWTPLAETVVGAVTKDAVTAARKVSPAAGAHVQRQLAQEGSNLLLGLQNDVVKRDISYQQGLVTQTELFSQQEFFLKHTPEERLAVRNNLETTLIRAASTGIIAPDDAAKRIFRFDKMVAQEGAVELALKGGLAEAFAYIDGLPTLTPDEKREARNKAEDTLSFQVKALAAQEKLQQKQLELNQDTLASTMYTRAALPSTPPQQLLTDMESIPKLVASGMLKGAAASQLTNAIEGRLKELSSPTPVRDNDDVRAETAYRIAIDPDSIRYEDIRNLSGLTGGTKEGFISQIKAARADSHYTKQPAYRQAIREMEAINIRVQSTLPWEQARPIQLEVARAITEYERAVNQAQQLKGVNTPLTDEELRVFDRLKDTIITRITTKQFSDVPGRGLGAFK